jgi:hypothetical protein
MHFAEALVPRDEAIALAAAEVRRMADRNAPYYAKAPGLVPDADGVLLERIRAEDAWYFIPFARRDAARDPVVVRFNALTRTAVIEKAA